MPLCRWLSLYHQVNFSTHFRASVSVLKPDDGYCGTYPQIDFSERVTTILALRVIRPLQNPLSVIENDEKTTLYAKRTELHTKTAE
ncbi:hypothetical protein DNV23_24770 [Salmonella enterica subsp. enterica serovar Hadar]|nr:hypothetical protein [Salmonella enterica subsp. enterica serovar Hadar]